jgi:predicted MFS family arabinose efflux permease
VALYGAAAVLAVAFVAIEARTAQPMLPLRLFRNPSFAGAQIGAVGISGSLFALWLYLTLYLQQVLGLSAIEAGLVFVPGTLVNFAVAGATASLGRFVPARVLVAFGLALIAAGLAVLTTIGVDSSWWLFLPGLIVAMVGTGMLNPALAQVALGSLPPEQSGLAAGVNDMFRQAGLAIGVAGLGALITTTSPRAYVDGLHDALWFGAALAAVCAVATALLIQSPARPSRSVKLAPDPAS